MVGYEGLYEVSSTGRVLSLPSSERGQGRRGVLLRQQASRWGYLRVKLSRNARAITRGVHRLVAAAFIGPMPDGLETRHLDGDPTHNEVGNLCYGTKSENAQDRLRHGHHNFANKTHCPQDHPYDEANTRMTGRSRWCLTCKREKNRAFRSRRKLAAQETGCA